MKTFSGRRVYKQYRYRCSITSLDLPAEQIWKIYRQRADAENRIKELKYDFGPPLRPKIREPLYKRVFFQTKFLFLSNLNSHENIF
jgi:hypothetical protein